MYFKWRYKNIEEKEPQKYRGLKYSKQNTKNENKNIHVTQTRNKDNQHRESKEDKPMPSCAAILKNEKKNTEHMKTKMKNQRDDEK